MTGGNTVRALPQLCTSTSCRLGVAIVVFVGTAAALAPRLAPFDPFALVGPSLAPPSVAHPFGTDALGRDLLSGLLHGARTSTVLALGVGAIVFVIGTSVGLVSGWKGGFIDDLLMRVTEAFQVLPRFFLAAICIAALGPGLDRVVLVLGLTSWPELARVVRSETLGLREREFVLAARALGASTGRILSKELLPNVMPAALVVVGITLGRALLIDAGLGFLGLGDPNRMSWGYLAGQAQPFLRSAWWLALFPGLAVSIFVLGLNLLADAANDALADRVR